jgi:hypothetical protein
LPLRTSSFMLLSPFDWPLMKVKIRGCVSAMVLAVYRKGEVVRLVIYVSQAVASSSMEASQ